MNQESLSEMTLADEMHIAIVELSGPPSIFDSRERWLERGANLAGISKRAAKAFFYREWPDPRASVVDAVRTAVARRTKEREAAERDELEEMRERIAILESRLATIDENFHRETISALRQAAPRNRRATDRQGD